MRERERRKGREKRKGRENRREKGTGEEGSETVPFNPPFLGLAPQHFLHRSIPFTVPFASPLHRHGTTASTVGSGPTMGRGYC